MNAWNVAVVAVLSLMLAAEAGCAGVLPLSAGHRLGSHLGQGQFSGLPAPVSSGHLGLRGGSAPADVQDVGKQFVGYYYQTFDSNRAGLAPLYQEVTFCGSPPQAADRKHACETSSLRVEATVPRRICLRVAL